MRSCPSTTNRRSLTSRAPESASWVSTRSSSSSSAIRIVIASPSDTYDLPLLIIHGPLRLEARLSDPLERQRNRKYRPLAGGAVDGHRAAVALGDLAAEREPDAGPGVLAAAVQALEDPEDAVGVPRVEADPVVADADLGEPAVDRAVHPDHRRDVGAPELDRVREQVLE